MFMDKSQQPCSQPSLLAVLTFLAFPYLPHPLQSCSSEVYSKLILPQLPEQSYGVTFSACQKIDRDYLELSKSILHSL